MNWGCFGKVKLKSAKSAKQAARRKDNRTWYLCSKCHYYHTGRRYGKTF